MGLVIFSPVASIGLVSRVATAKWFSAAVAVVYPSALADVAIIALIDEATGYQKRRAQNEPRRTLSAYTSTELLP
jgi:hypothetical protein